MISSSSSSSKPTRAAQPRRQAFDPWFSVATGHQIAETSAGVQWRAARNKKLTGQLGGGGGGRQYLDSVGPGAGAQQFDGALLLGATVTSEAQARERRSVRDMLMKPGLMRKEKHAGAKAGGATTTTHLAGTSAAVAASRDDKPSSSSLTSYSKKPLSTEATGAVGAHEETDAATAAVARAGSKKIFDGVTVYVNGSTYPLVSDHRLKHLLAEHGGAVSLHLGRRSVTHVVVGRPIVAGGSGGGLAGAKLEKEIRKRGGLGVKFVGVEWILESLKAGKKLPEARFATLKMARQGQVSVYGRFSKTATKE